MPPFAEHARGDPHPAFVYRRETFEMNVKIIALVVLVIALFGLVYSIERTARPPSQRIGATQLQSGGEGD